MPVHDVGIVVMSGVNLDRFRKPQMAHPNAASWAPRGTCRPANHLVAKGRAFRIVLGEPSALIGAGCI